MNKRPLLSIEGEKMRGHSVIILFYLCLPATVFFAVIPIVIYSSQSLILGSFSHINKEVLKCHPAVANLNTSASVVLKSFERFMKAAILHRLPTLVRSRPSCSSRMTVFKVHVPISDAVPSSMGAAAELKPRGVMTPTVLGLVAINALRATGTACAA